MKKFQLLSTGLFFVIAIVGLTSCGPSRYYSEAPRPRTSFSLIISPTPGFVMNRYSDGRYYYRSPEGYMYWRGADNRFYLDRQYINRGHYDQRQYNEWRRYNNGYHRRGHR